MRKTKCNRDCLSGSTQLGNNPTSYDQKTEQFTKIFPLFPEKKYKKKIAPVVPFFIPFAGCPHRCLFCAQDKQTGV
ncbi:MAG: hypothetical protein RRY20_05070, partial [Bilophila sp.]